MLGVIGTAAMWLMLGAGAAFAAESVDVEGWQRFERLVRDDQIAYEEGLQAIRECGGTLQRA